MTLSLIPIKAEMAKIDLALKEHLDTRVKLIRRPLKDMVSSGGKRLRPALVLASARLGPRYEYGDVESLAVAMELLHMATLIHDDIVDDSPIRRGQASIQTCLGKDIAVFTGDYLFARVFELLASAGDHQLLNLTSKALYKICEGEIRQREELFNLQVTLKDYLYRIKGKTATLFSLCCHLGAKRSHAGADITRALKNYGMKVGMAFQIMDDILDISGAEQALGKPLGTDIREGVITLPSIYALKCSRHRDTLGSILESRRISKEDIMVAIDIVRSCGGITYAKKISLKYTKKAKETISHLPEGPIKSTLLDIADYAISRKY